LLPDEGTRVMSLVRSGRALLPDPGSRLQTQDILHIGATDEGLAQLRLRLPANGNGKG
jgi:hypothetical protein